MSTPVVDEDDNDGDGCISLYVALGGDHPDARDDHGLPLHYFNFDWLNPKQLVAIAKDLLDADENGGDIRAVLRAWRSASMEEL